MSVILRKRPNRDGTTSLRLEIYHNGKRTYETLKHIKLAKPSNLLDREHNKQLLKQAESIRIARAAELDSNNGEFKSLQKKERKKKIKTELNETETIETNNNNFQ